MGDHVTEGPYRATLLVSNLFFLSSTSDRELGYNMHFRYLITFQKLTIGLAFIFTAISDSNHVYFGLGRKAGMRADYLFLIFRLASAIQGQIGCRKRAFFMQK